MCAPDKAVWQSHLRPIPHRNRRAGDSLLFEYALRVSRCNAVSLRCNDSCLALRANIRNPSGGCRPAVGQSLHRPDALRPTPAGARRDYHAERRKCGAEAHSTDSTPQIDPTHARADLAGTAPGHFILGEWRTENFGWNRNGMANPFNLSPRSSRELACPFNTQCHERSGTAGACSGCLHPASYAPLRACEVK